MVFSIVAMSRPTSAQCSARMSSVPLTSSSGPLVFQPSARSATIRSVLLRPGAADQDRQLRLDRTRRAQRVVERVEAALVAEPLAIEQAAHEHDRLVEPVEPLARAAEELDPEAVVLALEPGAADAEHGPAVRDVVERRGELGGQARVAERVRADHQPEPHPRRHRRRGRPGRSSPRRSAAPTARRWPSGGPTSRSSPSPPPRPRGPHRGSPASRSAATRAAARNASSARRHSSSSSWTAAGRNRNDTRC